MVPGLPLKAKLLQLAVSLKQKLKCLLFDNYASALVGVSRTVFFW